MIPEVLPWLATLDAQDQLAAALGLVLVALLVALRFAHARHRRAQARQLRERLIGHAEVSRRRAF